jgi:hypothetical protein
MLMSLLQGGLRLLMLLGAVHCGLVAAEPAQIVDKSLNPLKPLSPPPAPVQATPMNYSVPADKDESKSRFNNVIRSEAVRASPDAKEAGLSLGMPEPEVPAIPSKSGAAHTSASVDAADLKPPASPRVLLREQIVNAQAAERTFYWLQDNPRVLVLDMPNVEDQSRVFARLVIFIERSSAPRHRILSVDEVLKWQLANKETLATLTIGNNIRANDFALFFNTARLQMEPITEDEQWLLARLLEYGVIKAVENGYESLAPEKIVISAPQVSKIEGCANCTITPLKRDLILRHELAHARFITDQVYRNYVWWFWHNILTSQQRVDISKYLRSLGYDLGAPDMLINEMQAFLIHTPESEYFSSRAAGLPGKQLNEVQAAFKKHFPSVAQPLRMPAGYRLQ